MIAAREPIRSAPDLAIEVLSPTTALTDRGKKMQLLARHGVPEYWLVDPDTSTIEVYALSGDAYVLAQLSSRADQVHSMILPDLVFPAARVFPS